MVSLIISWSVQDVLPYLDSLCVKLEAVFGDQELLNIFALITLKLNHLTHLAIGDNGAIASCPGSVSYRAKRGVIVAHIPNFFLMTLRIFF